MTEDYAIKQGPSSTPYLLGGAVVGGGAGAALGAWKPGWAKEGGKYASYEDLLKESKDSFQSSMEGVDEDLKTKAQKAWQAGQDAGADYDKKLAEYQETNKGGEVVKDDNYKKLEADLEAKKSAVEAKRQELINAEVEKLKATNAGSTAGETTANKILKGKVDKLNKASEQLETLIAKNASKEEIATARANVQKIEKEIDSFAKELVEKLKFEGTEKEIKAAKEDAVKTINQYVHDKAQAKNLGRAGAGQPQLVRDLVAQDKAIETAKNLKEISYDKLAELTGKSKDDIRKLADIDLARTVKRNEDIEKRNVKLLKDTLAKFKATSAGAKDVEIGLKEILGLFLGKKIVIKPGETEVDAVKKAMEGLTENQQKVLSKLVKEGVSEESLNEAIKASEARINALGEAYDGVHNAESAVKKANIEKAKIKNKIKSKFGADANVRDGILYKGKKPYTAPVEKPIDFKLNIEGQKLEDIKFSRPATTALTEEQIAQKAKEAITDEALKAEIEAQKAAQTALDEAGAKLAKTEGKTVEQLAKEFVEKNGSKEDAIKKATEGFKDDVKKLFEGKLKNGKLAAIIGGGVAAGMLLGMAFKPKADEA